MSLRARFWERVPLARMTGDEWEALCDGCGKCCLLKLEDAETGEVHYTDVACRLFDDATCRCGNYALRKLLVEGCVVLDMESLPRAAPWMPRTCAYRRLWEGRGLPEWYLLVTGDAQSTHRAGVSVRGATVPEWDVPEEELEDRVTGED